MNVAATPVNDWFSDGESVSPPPLMAASATVKVLVIASVLPPALVTAMVAVSWP